MKQEDPHVDSKTRNEKHESEINKKIRIRFRCIHERNVNNLRGRFAEVMD